MAAAATRRNALCHGRFFYRAHLWAGEATEACAGERSPSLVKMRNPGFRRRSRCLCFRPRFQIQIQYRWQRSLLTFTSRVALVTAVRPNVSATVKDTAAEPQGTTPVVLLITQKQGWLPNVTRAECVRNLIHGKALRILMTRAGQKTRCAIGIHLPSAQFLLRTLWSRHKGHFSRRLTLHLTSRGKLRRQQNRPMLSNTSCSALLAPGASAAASLSCPP